MLNSHVLRTFKHEGYLIPQEYQFIHFSRMTRVSSPLTHFGRIHHSPRTTPTRKTHRTHATWLQACGPRTRGWIRSIDILSKKTYKDYRTTSDN